MVISSDINTSVIVVTLLRGDYSIDQYQTHADVNIGCNNNRSRVDENAHVIMWIKTLVTISLFACLKTIL